MSVARRNGLIWCWLGLGIAAPAQAQNPPPADIVALCQRVQPAYVFIGGGSGVVIRPDGLMLTNAHVIAKGKLFDVRLGNGRHYRAKLLGMDTFGDLAALKLELKPDEQVGHLELGDSEALQIGEPALAVGNPFGLGFVDQSPTFTCGVISALHYLQGRYTECIVTDAEVNPGNSGGPLVNMAGKVVGINGQISTRWGLRSNTGLGYAISARQIRLWLPRLEAANGGVVAHGKLPGLTFKKAANDSPDSLVIEDVAEGTAVAEGGLRAGDAIIRVDGQPVANAFRMASLIGIYPEGHQAVIDVRRGGQEVPLKVKLVAPRPGKLGVKFAEPGKDDATLKVAEVEKNSAAEKAGMKVGDELLELEGNKLSMPARAQFHILSAWMKNAVTVGTIVRMKVRRQKAPGAAEEVTLRMVPQ